MSENIKDIVCFANVTNTKYMKQYGVIKKK